MKISEITFSHPGAIGIAYQFYEGKNFFDWNAWIK